MDPFYEDRKAAKGVTKDTSELRFIVRRIISKLSIPERGAYRVLDMGCDDGYILSRLYDSNRELDLYGIDISHEAIATAKKINSERCIEFIESDATSLPFSDGFFDFIICSQILEHIEAYKDSISEIERCLGEGRRCYVGTANHVSPDSPYHGICKKIDEIDGHVTRFKVEELVDMFDHSRLDDLEYEGYFLSMVYYKILYSRHKESLMKILVGPRGNRGLDRDSDDANEYLQLNTLGKIMGLVALVRSRLEMLIFAKQADSMAINLVFQKTGDHV